MHLAGKPSIEKQSIKSATTESSSIAINKNTPKYFIWKFIVIIILTCIPIIQIYLGAKYTNACPVDPRIPIYLFVAGIIYISILMLFEVRPFINQTNSRLKHARQLIEDHGNPNNYKNNIYIVFKMNDLFTKFVTGIMICLQIFSFLWFVFGFILVFRTWKKITYNPLNHSQFCPAFVYRFTYIYSCILVITVGLVFAFYYCLRCTGRIKKTSIAISTECLASATNESVLNHNTTDRNQTKIDARRIFSIIHTFCLFISPIILVVFGTIYANACPINPKIPNYLLICGIISIINVILNQFRVFLSVKYPHAYDDITVGNAMRIFLGNVISLIVACLGVFLTIWYVFGFIWIFDVWNEVQYIPLNHSQFCSSVLYRFAYIIFAIGTFWTICIIVLTIIFDLHSRFWHGGIRYLIDSFH
ncbi:hypothetical protein I4U23_005401 [Adineta vaga]|nr:hypothetical protein I4U23_005401 [Adineta vaga]